MIDWERELRRGSADGNDWRAKPKRKRGGLAGIWDRNKGAIGSIAGGLAASFIPGAGAFLVPAIGGALGGAAARGKLDTGRLAGDALGGIGGGGIKSGYGSLKDAFTPGAARAASPAMPGIPGMAPPIPSIPGAGATTSVGDKLMGAAGKVGGYLKDNPEVPAMALQGIGSAMGAGAQRDIARDQLAQQQSQFDQRLALERQQYEEEMERKRRIAELLGPVYAGVRGRSGPLPQPAVPMMGG